MKPSKMVDIVIDREVYDELFAVSKWYAAMPSTKKFRVGDSFYDRVTDFQNMCIFAQVDPILKANDELFINEFEIVDGELYVHLGYDGAPLAEGDTYKIVAKS